ncbi:MAG: ACT domain-containing protein [Crocinitomicaceae bacterium]|nr:ACT domain-containing protein [Crocinitomicaceae bacterium]
MNFQIDKKLQEVIDCSWFTIDEGTYAYTKVTEIKHVKKHLIITQDSDEITVVTDIKNLKDLGDYERNAEDWKLINIRCGNPFYCVGFLAAISSQTALNGLDITMTSTYTNDYIMCKEEELEKCTSLLILLGFSKRANRD